MKSICSAKMEAANFVGGCNFCSRHVASVWVIKTTDEYRRLQIHICKKCWQEINRSMKKKSPKKPIYKSETIVDEYGSTHITRKVN